ncbi:MAG: hypothetical protein AAGA87_00060 [Pseudomonadota bacterium]
MEILQTIEDFPATYPDAPADLSTEAAALDPDALWRRIEAYIAHRWTERQVAWIVEGPGCFTPTLTPATITSVEIWQTGEWQSVTLSPAPLGQVLPGAGPYRFTANVGAGTVPPDVMAAFRRLAEYLRKSGEDTSPGSRSTGVSMGEINLSTERAPTWIARALDYSGAADLLRPYRRV